MIVFISILVFVFIAIIIAVVVLVIKLHQEEAELRELTKESYILLEILVPRNNEKGPLHAESMFAALHGIYDHSRHFQSHISFEITSKNKYILFYCWVPARLKDFVEGQIYAQYPTVEIREAPEDYSLNINPSLKLAGTTLELNKNDVFPIKTFPNFEVDPLSSITGVLSKVSKKEQIWIQMLIRPVADDWQQKGINYVNKIRAGENPEEVALSGRLLSGAFDLTKELVKTATTLEPTENSGSEGEIKLSGPEEEALAAIEQKTTKLGFESKIRIVAVAETERLARRKLRNAVSAFKQFNAININGFSSKEVLTNREILKKYQERVFQKPGYILNIEELASIYHLPHVTVETPSIAWAGSKKGEPPSNLPIDGSVDSLDLTLFARTNFRHFQQKFGIKSHDRRLHFYAIGKTGTGKSTMLENMIIDDIEEGRGVAVVDPHGDLVEHILDFIPEKRIQDVVYFAPHDREYPIGFNILEAVNPDLKSIVASGVVGIFKKIFGDSWGPRLEYILRNTILSLLDYPDATMLGITRILVDTAYRKKVISKVKDPVIKDFWKNEFGQYDQKFRTEAVAPIQNKVGQFLSTSTVRNIVGQSKSTIDIREIMDNKRILLIDLAVGRIGEDISALLGAMMITKIQLAAMQRASIAEERRTDFYLYVDEFQNFATESFATILSEARKYHLNLIMTNQYIAQMPEMVRDAVFGNVGTLVSFRVGAADAEFMVKEFEPVFDVNDLVNIDNYNIYVKMAIDGVTSNPFSAMTLPPRVERYNNREKIIAFSRRHYSRSREEVEGLINRWAEDLEEENYQLHVYETQAGQRRAEEIKKLGYKKIKSLTGKSWYIKSTESGADQSGGKSEKKNSADSHLNHQTKSFQSATSHQKNFQRKESSTESTKEGRGREEKSKPGVHSSQLHRRIHLASPGREKTNQPSPAVTNQRKRGADQERVQPQAKQGTIHAKPVVDREFFNLNKYSTNPQNLAGSPAGTASDKRMNSSAPQIIEDEEQEELSQLKKLD